MSQYDIILYIWYHIMISWYDIIFLVWYHIWYHVRISFSNSLILLLARSLRQHELVPYVGEGWTYAQNPLHSCILGYFQESSQNFKVFIVDATRPGRITQARKMILIITSIIWVHGSFFFRITCRWLNGFLHSSSNACIRGEMHAWKVDWEPHIYHIWYLIWHHNVCEYHTWYHIHYMWYHIW